MYMTLTTLILFSILALNTSSDNSEFMGTQPSNVSPLQLVTPDDKDRGCCFLKSSTVQCAATNRGYCRKLANDQNVDYEFYRGAQCENIASCPVKPTSQFYDEHTSHWLFVR